MSSLILLFSLLVPWAGAASAQPEELRMWMTVGERRFAITLTDNAAARAFAAQLPLTLDMSELNGNEKHADLPKPLPANANRPGTIRNGDLMLYGADTLVVLSDVSIVVLVHSPRSGGRPFRPATGARAARCSSRVF
jgi:Tfp pilus assembly protein PilP